MTTKQQTGRQVRKPGPDKMAKRRTSKPTTTVTKLKNGGPVKKPTNRKIKVRGTGAATKGLFARGPMA
ncbi:MAG: hypothetical protein CBC24_07325 [Candidatus Pelagibacter sp. TMED64]|nr:MAG: hypothetical protein CBC24_07325 [Candidatus Pelagibacter sp. TMED64]|tara:strand:+ start:1124 stop:1327 length:204 start_codon:yes stop_codon:yes gene_type:complete